MLCLISSRQIAGQPSAWAISWASVVLPEPGGPLTTARIGAVISAFSHFVERHARVSGTGVIGRFPSGPRSLSEAEGDESGFAYQLRVLLRVAVWYWGRTSPTMRTARRRNSGE